MATTRRKPAAKKTPAAAKKTTTRRKTIAKVVPVALDFPDATTGKPYTVVADTEEQRQAKLEAYHALKSAGVPVPDQLATEVEGWLADLHAQREAEIAQFNADKAQRDQELAEANQNGPWYVRNGYPAPFNLRLDRQTEKRRIELKARGTPGDLHPIKDEDLSDPVLKQNLSLGIIEIIPAGEAQIIIDKQTTNLGHRVHTPLAILRNEQDQPYRQGQVKVEAEFNAQGVTVAHVDKRVLTGELSDREIGGVRGHGGLTRVQPGQTPQQVEQTPQQATSVVHSGFVPTGGNPATIQYGPMGDNARAQVVDSIARQKNIQGPAAGLGDIRVVVDPVQRT